MSGPAVMIPGVEFDFGGGRVYLVPPLSLGALQLLHDRLTKLPTLAATDPGAVLTIVDATHIALRRNYPSITREEVAELLDLSNVGDVYECLMDVAGIKRRAQQAERDAAKNPPATSPSTGPGSSPESAPTPAGPGSTSAST